MEIRSPHPDQHVCLLASVPLSDEGWQALPEGTVLALEEPREG
jgi:predicted glutamine amidotransferase